MFAQFLHEKMLKPLNKLKVPVHEIAMMMSIALRFILIMNRKGTPDNLITSAKKSAAVTYPPTP